MDQLTESDSPNSSLPIQPSISSSSRSILAIDLNQIPSPSETLASPPFLLSPTSLVRSFHHCPPLPMGPPAQIPTADAVCAAGCGLDASDDWIECDGCERGFHFACAGTVPVGLIEVWLCSDCVRDGVSSRGWPLGRTQDGFHLRLLDMNVSPPRDVGDSVANVVDLTRYARKKLPF